MPGTDGADSATCLRARYAMPGTDERMVLRPDLEAASTVLIYCHANSAAPLCTAKLAACI
eukprot:3530175-Rhodomonas_salina.2